MATDGSVGASLFQKVEYLSLARNRFVGSTDALDGSSLLKTLILNGNYFSCSVTRVEAEDLGKDYFRNPADSEIEKTGVQLGEQFPFVNPYTDWTVQEYPNVAILFSGNPALTTEAATLPPVDPGVVLKADVVRKGHAGLFGGFDAFKTMVFIMIPVLVLLHLFSILVTVYREENVFAAFRTYFRPDINNEDMAMNHEDGIRCYLIRSTVMPMCYVSVICVMLIALYMMITDGVYMACIDPWVYITSAYISKQPSAVFQWAWVLAASAVLLIFGWMMDRMAQDSRSERAGALHRILCDFTIRGSVQKQVHLQPLPMHLQPLPMHLQRLHLQPLPMHLQPLPMHLHPNASRSHNKPHNIITVQLQWSSAAIVWVYCIHSVISQQVVSLELSISTALLGFGSLSVAYLLADLSVCMWYRLLSSGAASAMWCVMVASRQERLSPAGWRPIETSCISSR